MPETAAYSTSQSLTSLTLRFVLVLVLREHPQQTRHGFNTGEEVFGKEGRAPGKTTLRPSSPESSKKGIVDDHSRALGKAISSLR